MTIQETTNRDVRGEIADDALAIRLMDYPDSTEEIPTLDFAPYREGRAGGREVVAAKLREISRTVGFFYLTNHGIPQSLIAETFAQARRFHALPEAEKQKIPWFDDARFKVGYEGTAITKVYGNVNIVANTKPNFYSKFAIGREGGPQGEMNAKLWPEGLPGFRDTLLAYNDAIEKLGKQFLPLWCESLKLPLDFFDRHFEAPQCQLSLNHYPPQKEVGNRQYGIAPHTDNAFMTFLAQGDISGLAVRMPSGRWRLVDVIPDTLVVNTGNSLVRWTNEEYLSTKHRVINTNTIDRYSIPVFFGPSDDTVIDIVPTCRGPNRPPLYEPTTYGKMRSWYYGVRKQDPIQRGN
jgi:isopenicillin N synthase-like dioxygenase